MQLMTVDDNPQYVYPIARFSDTRYRVKYQGIRDYGLGLFVDIYPLDGCGDTEEEAGAWVQQPMRDVKFINCCAADRFTPSRRGWLHTPAKLAGFAWARLHGSAHYIHRIEAWARQKDYEKCRYVGCTVWDTNWNIVFLREDLEKTLYVPFEDGEFPIPAGEMPFPAGKMTAKKLTLLRSAGRRSAVRHGSGSPQGPWSGWLRAACRWRCTRHCTASTDRPRSCWRCRESRSRSSS